PYRLEWFGDEIDSVRQFSPGTQRSLGAMPAAELTALVGEEDGASALGGHLCEHLPAGSWTVLVEAEDLREQGKHSLHRVPERTGLFPVEGASRQLPALPSVKVSALPSPGVETAYHLRVESVERFSGEVGRVRAELDAAAAADRVLVACQN